MVSPYFTKGDLCYVPQDVILFNIINGDSSYYRTERPTAALFIEQSDSYHFCLLLNGKRWMVKSKHVYPYSNTDELQEQGLTDD